VCEEIVNIVNEAEVKNNEHIRYKNLGDKYKQLIASGIIKRAADINSAYLSEGSLKSLSKEQIEELIRAGENIEASEATLAGLERDDSISFKNMLCSYDSLLSVDEALKEMLVMNEYPELSQDTSRKHIAQAIKASMEVEASDLKDKTKDKRTAMRHKQRLKIKEDRKSSQQKQERQRLEKVAATRAKNTPTPDISGDVKSVLKQTPEKEKDHRKLDDALEAEEVLRNVVSKDARQWPGAIASKLEVSEEMGERIKLLGRIASPGRNEVLDNLRGIGRQEADEGNHRTMYIWSKPQPYTGTKSQATDEEYRADHNVLTYIDSGASHSLCTRTFVETCQYKVAQVSDYVKMGTAIGGGQVDLSAFVHITVLVEAVLEGMIHRIPIHLRCRVVEDDELQTAPILIGGSDLCRVDCNINPYRNNLEFLTTGGRKIITKQLTPEVVRTARRLDRVYSDRFTLFAVQVTSALDLSRKAYKVAEASEFKRWEEECNDTRDDLRPALFPKEYWQYLPLRVKEKALGIYSRYSEERLVEIIARVEKIDISQEDDERKAESKYIRALCYARLDAFFVIDESKIEHIPKYEFKLEIEDEKLPLKAIPRGYSIEERAFLEAKCKKMIKQGRLVKRPGIHTNGIVLVPYPERIKAFHDRFEGTKALNAMMDPVNSDEISQWFRLTGDFRILNKRLRQHRFPLPRVENLLNVKENSGRWSTGDIEDAFFCIRMSESSQPWTGFDTHEGHFEYLSMPQGVSSAPMFWAMVVDDTFNVPDLKALAMFWYQDDVFVHDNSFYRHCDTLLKVLDRMVSKGLVFKISKTHLNYRAMKVLGHIMTRQGRLPDPEMVRAINDWAVPRDQKEVRSMVGLAMFVKGYVKNMSDIITPLQDLLKKNVVVEQVWKDEIHGKALSELKRIITSEPVLRCVDITRPFRIHVDACRRGRGIGAVLLQQNPDDNNRWHPVSFWSLKLTNAEREYSATDLECKAMHDAIEHWSTYLRNGLPFEVVTDHYALVYLVNKPMKDSNGRLMRYIMDLQQYNFSTIHRRGEDHVDADAMSRLFRYDDSELRVLMAADLVERGPVTAKDEQDLEKYFDVKLADPGINIATIEERLDNIQPARRTHDRSTLALIQKIELRHELEKLAGALEDNDVDWAHNDDPTGDPLPELMKYITVTAEPKQTTPPKPLENEPILAALSAIEKDFMHGSIFQRRKLFDVEETSSSKPKRRIRFSSFNMTKIYDPMNDTPNNIATRASLETLMSEKQLDERTVSMQARIIKQEQMEKEATLKLIAEAEETEDAEIIEVAVVASIHLNDQPQAMQWDKLLSPSQGFLEYLKQQSGAIRTESESVGYICGMSMNDRTLRLGKKQEKQPLVTVPNMDKSAMLKHMRNVIGTKSQVKSELGTTEEHSMSADDKAKLRAQTWAIRRGSKKKREAQKSEEILYEDKKISENEVEARVTRSRTQATRDAIENRAKLIAEAITMPISEQDKVYIDQLSKSDTEDHYDDIITPEIEREVDSYKYLIDKIYEDEENGRKYRVTNVFYDKYSQLICAYRNPADGRPSGEGDNDAFVVDEGVDSIVNRVAEYEEKYPREYPDYIVSFEELRVEQMKDEHLSALIKTYEDPTTIKKEVKGVEYLEIHEPSHKKPSLYYVNVNDPEEKRVLWKINTFHQDIESTHIEQQFLSVVVPERYRDSILEEYHHNRGHAGASRMMKTIKLCYTWKGMTEDVKLYVAECAHCRLRKAGNGGVGEPPIMTYPKLRFPFERCHVDLFGPLTKSKRGNTFVLVFKDALTKWVEIFALPDATMESVAECMIDEIFMRHGSPEILVSDRGSPFVNSLMKQLCSLLKIKKVTTAPYNPRADGLAENAVKTTKDMLSSYVNVMQDDWDEYLSIVAHYYRTTVNEATGMTPYFLLHGRECRHPDQQWIQQHTALPSSNDYVYDYAVAMETLWEVIGLKEYEHAKEVTKKSYAKAKRFKSLSVGDKVMMKRVPARFFTSEENQKSKIRKAFQDKFTGPYEILKKISPVTYIINVNGEDIPIAYKNLIKTSSRATVEQAKVEKKQRQRKKKN
jgi:transposase InsO family protein